jgi:hypothetical protein
MFTPSYQYGASFTVKTPGANLPQKQRTRFSPSYPNLRHPLARLQQMSGAAVSSLGKIVVDLDFASTTLQYVHSSRSEKCDRRQGYGRLHHH